MEHTGSPPIEGDGTCAQRLSTAMVPGIIFVRGALRRFYGHNDITKAKIRVKAVTLNKLHLIKIHAILEAGGPH